MKNKSRISTDGGDPLANNPFANLSLEGLPDGPAEVPTNQARESKTSKRGAKNKKRGRVDIIRQTAHRGGKTVTVISGFVGIGLPEKESLAKMMQKSCGVGGTVKDGNIEIQGDQREKVSTILTEAGFRPVMAGG
jgi:translation initiation factor 1